MCFAPQRRALFRDLNFQKWSEPLVFLTFWLRNLLRATTACTFSTSQLPKVVREWCVLCILTSKWMCFAPHRRALFGHLISTSKSRPTLRCFVHFDFQMCFSPQRRALFRHLNCQKSSDAEVFCTCWLGNVLRATTACNFSSHLASWLRTRRFSALRSPKSLEKHCVSRLSYHFTHLHLLSSYTLSLLLFFLLIFLFSLPLPCSAFHLSILSEVWLLNFLRLCSIYIDYCWLYWYILMHYDAFLINLKPTFIYKI